MIIPYLGEKSKFASFIVPKIPDNIETYVEPFAGAFGIFFSLDFSKFKNVKFVYNDINYLNYNLFRQLKINKSFMNLVNSTKVNEDLYKESLKIIFTKENKENLALNWLIILTCSSPHKIGKYSWRGNTEFEIFKMKYLSYKNQIDKIYKISNLDYKKIIKKYDSKSTFFYIDPPYKGKENYYINHNFIENSHYELANMLNKIKGRFILSYYHFDGLEDLYPNCNFESKKTIMGTEWIIMNY